MKALLPYLIILVVSTVAACLVFAVIALVSPKTLAPVGSDHVAAADTSKSHHTGVDSTKTRSTVAAADSVVNADSVAHEAEPPELATQAPDSASIGNQASVDTVNRASVVPGSDSTRAQERKNLAKVFESMEPERAARILKNLSDEELRATILTLKRRQAAKILAALDPDRVARIMR